jgi:hypothetical protein
MTLQGSMASIFISYRRDDTGGYSGRLAQDLRAQFGNDAVFIDVNIEGGRRFEAEIEAALGHCGLVIALIGPRWRSARDSHDRRRLDRPDDFLRLELEWALRRGVGCVPVLVQGAKLPSLEELPQSLRGLMKYQAVELSDERWDYDVQRLVEAVERAGIRRHTAWPRSTWYFALALLLALGGAAWASMSGGPSHADALRADKARPPPPRPDPTSHSTVPQPPLSGADAGTNAPVALTSTSDSAPHGASGPSVRATAPVRVEVTPERDSSALYRDEGGRLLAFVARRSPAFDLSAPGLLLFEGTAQRFNSVPIVESGAYAGGKRKIYFDQIDTTLEFFLVADEQRVEVRCGVHREHLFQRVAPEVSSDVLASAAFYRLPWLPRTLAHDSEGNWTYVEHAAPEDAPAGAKAWRVALGRAGKARRVAVQFARVADMGVTLLTEAGQLRVQYTGDGELRSQVSWQSSAGTTELSSVPIDESLALLSQLGLSRAAGAAGMLCR